MGSGASTQKIQLLNDAIKKDVEFDEETQKIFDKMPAKGFVKKDGRRGFLVPLVNACKLGRVKIVKKNAKNKKRNITNITKIKHSHL